MDRLNFRRMSGQLAMEDFNNNNNLIYLRDELNDQILAFEVRGLNVERVDHNQYVPNAKVLLETLLSDLKGAPHKDFQDMTEFTTLSFPNIKQQDVLMTLLIWNVFTFFLDDFLEGHTTKLEYWVKKWELKINAGFSSGTEFLDLFWNDLRARMNKVLSEKMVLQQNSWYMKYLGFFAETEKVKTGQHIYTLDEYDALRIIDIGYDILQMFLFASTKFDPDEYPEIVNDEAWTPFNTWANRHLYLVNDLYSSKKEVLLHQGKYTLIYIIMFNEKCDAQTAADKLVAMINEAWTMVIKYGDKLRLHNIPLLQQYITDIMLMCKGNLYWSTITPRYIKLSLYDNYQLQA